MKHKIILSLLVIFTFSLSYYITLQGIWTPENPPIYARFLVAILIFGLMSTITVIPYYTFVAMQKDK